MNNKSKKQILYRMLLIIGLCGFLTLSERGTVLSAQPDVSGSDAYALTGSFGYVEVPHTTYRIYDDTDIPYEKATNLPAAYDSRSKNYITSVKNQYSWGTCWSFATMAALESGTLTQQIESNLDLSEYHLCYYNYKSVLDPLGGTRNDSVTGNGSFVQFLNNGGNVLVAFHALANWTGAVEEEITGYSFDAVELESTAQSAYLNDIVHLQQMYQLHKEDVNEVKEMIMEYGAVTASFYYDSYYFRNDTGAYYTTNFTNSNHAVVIVGWDDNYPKENFKTSPEENGAWLIKNSWGYNFGESGYLWLSYEDTSLQDTMCVLVGESADNYDNNYQYDGSYFDRTIMGMNKVTAANIFAAQEGETQETVRAVSFEVGNTNIDYSIQIYGNLKDRSDPQSGTPRMAEPLTGSTKYQGYYTIELSEPILVQPEETFAVVIEFTKSGIIEIIMETSFLWNQTSYVASAQENQSFVRYASDRYWEDSGVRYGGNLRIKTFTDNTDIAARKLVSGIVMDQEQIEMTVGEEMQLTAHVLPDDADNKEVSWISSDEDIAAVTRDGKIRALQSGTAQITCITEEDQFEAVCEIIVRDSLSFAEQSIELTVGEEMELNLIKNGNAQSEILDLYIWSTGNPDVAVVSDMGVITGTGKGSCLVSCVSKADEKVIAVCSIHILTGFQDIRTSEWSYPFVLNVYDKEVMTGKSLVHFGTNEVLTRAEFVIILYAYQGKEDVIFRNRFLDVKVSDWYANAVIWAYDLGIVSGYGNGAFGAADSITREQLVLMLYQYGKLTGCDLSYEPGAAEAFTDGDRVSSYASNAIDWAIEKGLIAGKGIILDPQGKTTRAECAAIITRFIELCDAVQDAGRR